MTSVEVLGSLDGFPPLLTIDEAAEAMRIAGRWRTGWPISMRRLMVGTGCRSCGSDRASGYRAGRWPSSSPLDGSSGWPMDRPADTTSTDERIGDTVAVTIGAGADEARRALGPTAWCALEVLATTPLDDGDADGWIVASSVRALAAQLGVAVNTAQRALAALRKAGLVEPVQSRRETGRFGPSAYRLDVDPDVLSRQPRARLAGSDPVIPSRRIASKSPEAASVSVEFGQQLVLLPS